MNGSWKNETNGRKRCVTVGQMQIRIATETGIRPPSCHLTRDLCLLKIRNESLSPRNSGVGNAIPTDITNRAANVVCLTRLNNHRVLEWKHGSCSFTRSVLLVSRTVPASTPSDSTFHRRPGTPVCHPMSERRSQRAPTARLVREEL